MPNSELDTSHGGGGELEPIEEFEDEVEAELEALFALSQVHAEVAVAYEIVAQDVSARSIHDKLLDFARDHRSLVAEIGAYLKAQSVEPAALMPPPESSAFATLANALSAMAPESGLRSLSVSEQFAAASYAALLDVTQQSAARTMIERNLADGRRRARWLADHSDADLVSSEAEEQ